MCRTSRTESKRPSSDGDQERAGAEYGQPWRSRRRCFPHSINRRSWLASLAASSCARPVSTAYLFVLRGDCCSDSASELAAGALECLHGKPAPARPQPALLVVGRLG